MRKLISPLIAVIIASISHAAVLVEMSGIYDKYIWDDDSHVATITNSVVAKITFGDTAVSTSASSASYNIIDYQVSFNGGAFESMTIGPTFSSLFVDVNFMREDSFSTRQTFTNPGDTGIQYVDKGVQYLVWQWWTPLSLSPSYSISDLIGLTEDVWADVVCGIWIDGEEFGFRSTTFSATSLVIEPSLYSPKLVGVSIQAAFDNQPSRFSGTVTNGPPNGTARLQVSLDLGVTDPWVDLVSATLDVEGSATFISIPDSRLHAVGTQSNYFRVVTESAPGL